MQALPLIEAGSIPLDRAEEVPFPHWKMLARVSEEELGRLDLVFMQFVAHVGLPGSENLNPWGCIRKVGQMTDRVEDFTERRMYQFRRDPANFENSEAYFRMLCLATVLQKEFGVRYDLAKVPREVPFGVEDTTVHGIIFGNGGTCASLPVLYASVGRKLGYPLKLVSSFVEDGIVHLFVRWGGGGERFNIETTGTGLCTLPDDHYRSGEYKMTPQIEGWGRFLLSMSPREELSGFLYSRAMCWKKTGHLRWTTECFAWASGLDPQNLIKEDSLRRALNDWTRWTKREMPPGFPEITIERPRGHRFFPERLSEDYEKQILGLTAVENLLLDGQYGKVWAKMQHGMWKGKGPNHAVICYKHDGSSEATVTFNA